MVCEFRKRCPSLEEKEEHLCRYTKCPQTSRAEDKKKAQLPRKGDVWEEERREGNRMDRRTAVMPQEHTLNAS